MSPRAGRATEKAIGLAGESHTATAVPWDVGPVADTLDQYVHALKEWLRSAWRCSSWCALKLPTRRRISARSYVGRAI